MHPSRSVLALLLAASLWLNGCLPKAAACEQPDVFCVGLVTDVGRRDDRSYNQAAWEGIQQAKSSGIANWTASIETVDARDYEENISVFAQAGYDVIVTVGSAMSDATRLEANAFPDSYFIGVDQDQSANPNFNPNLTGLVFAEDQIGFLAGAMAALLSEAGQVDAVCASDVLPSMQRYGMGFLAGAAYINPLVRASATYHNEVDLDKTFTDPDWGQATGNRLIDSGTDIIFSVGGTTASNVLVTAAMRGAYAIGADTDQYLALPVAAPHLYASILKMITPGVAELIVLAKGDQDGSSVFPSGNYAGQVGLSPYHDLDAIVPEEVKQHMSELTRALLAGEIQTGVTVTGP
jgi:basic membrane protein A and related proteins